MRRLFIFLAICLLLCSACGKSHNAQVLESMQAVETAMRMNINDPDALFKALDDCIEKYTPLWTSGDAVLQSQGEADYFHEYNIYVESHRKTQMSIINLDLEIQDRLKDDPEKLQTYYQKLAQIGRK